MRHIWITLFVAGCLFAGETLYAKPGTGGSSRPPSSGSGGKPKFGSPSKPTAPKPPPVSKPAPPVSKPSAPVAKPPSSTESSKPKFGSLTSPSKPVTGNDKPKPNSGVDTTVSGSRKPESKPQEGSAKSQAQKEVVSERRFNEQKAKDQPKPEPSRRPDPKVTETIRSKPVEQYKPEVREQRVTTHVTHHHYNHPSSWYYSQPVVHVGGGYSSAFWWMMMEWDAERRARWLYNHRYSIETSAYERGMRDASVAAEVAKLEARSTQRDTAYVDKEFADNPDLMYTQEAVEATVAPSRAGWVILWVFVGLGGVALTVWFVGFKRWGN